MIDTPSDKVVFPLASISVFVSVAKMSAQFGEKHHSERGLAVI